jgi:hypothetical protein
MATKEQYESGADILARRVKEAPTFERKMTLMGCLGNLRSSQYKATGELRAKQLAENCYNASTRFFHKAVVYQN